MVKMQIPCVPTEVGDLIPKVLMVLAQVETQDLSLAGIADLFLTSNRDFVVVYSDPVPSCIRKDSGAPLARSPSHAGNVVVNLARTSAPGYGRKRDSEGSAADKQVVADVISGAIYPASVADSVEIGFRLVG